MKTVLVRFADGSKYERLTLYCCALMYMYKIIKKQPDKKQKQRQNRLRNKQMQRKQKQKPTNI